MGRTKSTLNGGEALAHHDHANCDGDTCRRELTVSEKVALAKALEQLGSAREDAGRSAGLSGGTYYKARYVVRATANEELPEPVREVAVAAKAEMDSTGSVTPAYLKVKAAREAALAKPQKTVIGTAAQQRKAVRRAVTNLSGITFGLAQIAELHPDITSEEAALWVDGLSDARRVLEVLIKRCKERISNE